MTLTAAIAIYFVLWWLVLFAVLPWGVRSLHEEGPVEDGNDPGAPLRPMLLRKALVTTLISAIIFAAGWALWEPAVALFERMPMPFETI